MKLDVRGLKKAYRQGSEKIEVLKSVDFSLSDGEVAAVLGQSGSGKTTLLSLLAGLDQGDQGSIHLGETELNRLSEDERTVFRGHHIGIVFQSYHLVPHLTALENVMLPLDILGEPDAEKRARAMLESVGLSHRLSHFPSQLSGGESQRTALARALVTGPKILLADEPSGHLDQETGRKVMDLFFSVVRENRITTLLVTHDADLAARCDRRFLLKSGVLG